MAKKIVSHRERTKKILNNNFNNVDIDTRKINFTVDNMISDNMDMEDRLHYEMLEERVSTLIENSEFNKFNILEDDKMPKLKKKDINEIYYFVSNKLKHYDKIDIFAILCDYFDTDYHKFFSCLSNTFKEDLIEQLNVNIDIFNKKKIRKLF